MLKSEPPRSANRRPKLLHSSLSFISKGPFLQFSGTFSDDFFRHRIHQNVLLFIKIPAQQTASNSDTGRDRTGSRKSHGEARASLSPTLMIHFPDERFRSLQFKSIRFGFTIVGSVQHEPVHSFISQTNPTGPL
ncbi:hypothetical protein PIB30_007085 [Stylosanthes scabra]|uniref:Uncharacterized protein n=1 Tax=Stylosanthes scabra TaxID=79078 RepID=A0ABU6R4H6_9FABA|nr:hypothetical protein [Stylosanthes scabra]